MRIKFDQWMYIQLRFVYFTTPVANVRVIRDGKAF